MALPTTLTLNLPPTEAEREEALKDVCEIAELPVEPANAKAAISKIVKQRIENFKKKKREAEAEAARQVIAEKEITPTQIS